MNPSVLKKRVGIAVAVLALAAGVVAGRERPTLELVQERAPRAAAVATTDDGIDLDKLRRSEASLPQKDLFAPMNMGRQAPMAAQAPAKPVAPALPFRYFGRVTWDGKTEVFVMRGEELLSIAAGQKLGDYRVDQVAESKISFTYLPLKTKQTLEIQ